MKVNKCIYQNDFFEDLDRNQTFLLFSSTNNIVSFMDPHILVPDMFSNKKYSPLDIFCVCYDFSPNNKTYAHAHFYTVKVKYPSEVAKRKTYF